MKSNTNFQSVLENTLQKRIPYLDDNHNTACRILNGFQEGIPDLIVELYGRTLVIHDYAQDLEVSQSLQKKLEAFYLLHLPWVDNILIKKRNDSNYQNRTGIISTGKTLDKKIIENGIWYALDLQLNQDTSFYLDTRNLRSWSVNNLHGKNVLNTFAYTGSLGLAAKIAQANLVIQTDRTQRFLELAKKSYQLNKLQFSEKEFILKDFFPLIKEFKKQKRLFDCVFLDPPFFSDTNQGRINIVTNHARLVNKIRPIIAHDGWIVSINNALFLSGQEYIDCLNRLCEDGYLKIDQIINIPPDITGFPETKTTDQLTDPAPFNHSTKIAILRVFRKDQRME